jgi:hypothetical protein
MRQAEGKLAVTVPAAQRDAVDTVVRMGRQGSAMDVRSWRKWRR